MWTYNQNPYELYHHGILGMKWGVRRYQNPDGTYTPAGKKRRTRDFASEAKSMSTEELRRTVNRRYLENRYDELTNGNRNSKFVSASNDATRIADSGLNIVRSAKGKKNQSVKNAQNTLDIVKKGTGLAKRTNDIINKRNVKDLSQMTDKQLAEEVNRLDLERQYVSLEKRNVQRGKIAVRDYLDIAGDVLGIASSAVALGVGIKKLRK